VGDLDLSVSAQHWLNLALIWIGFGTVAGVLAATLVPGRRRGGVLAVVVIGIAGSTLGPLVLTSLWPRDRFNPISPLGMVAAIAGALVLLMIYQVIAKVLPEPAAADRSDESNDNEGDAEEDDPPLRLSSAGRRRPSGMRIVVNRRGSSASR
jgi:uncharacterized membrane protein YeaQ/YmgE (transglycosylase-associated protein family)